MSNQGAKFKEEVQKCVRNCINVNYHKGRLFLFFLVVIWRELLEIFWENIFDTKWIESVFTMCTCSTDINSMQWKNSERNSLSMPYGKSDTFIAKLFLSPRIPRARLKKWKNKSVSFLLYISLCSLNLFIFNSLNGKRKFNKLCLVSC